VKLLVRNGADSTVPSDKKVTPMFIACNQGHLEVVKEMLPMQTELEQPDVDDDTLLITAADNGKFDVVKLLLEQETNRPNINAKNNDEKTAIYMSSVKGNTEVL
jgi:ankyrin repeat protein